MKSFYFEEMEESGNAEGQMGFEDFPEVMP